MSKEKYTIELGGESHDVNVDVFRFIKSLSSHLKTEIHKNAHIKEQGTCEGCAEWKGLPDSWIDDKTGIDLHVKTNECNSSVAKEHVWLPGKKLITRDTFSCPFFVSKDKEPCSKC